MSLAFDFSGRTVLITGGGRGIGSLIRFFADAGATTAVIDVDDPGQH